MLKTEPRLYGKFKNEVAPALREEFSYKSPMQTPRISKVVVSMGVKEGAGDVKLLDHIAGELAMITGQKPLVTRAKKSIAGFKLRQGVPIGLKVTLRGIRMYEFLDRLFNVAMPRIRDFQGYSDRSFDNQANYSLGIQEQIIFPEVEYDKVKKTQGMDITFVTTAKTKEEAKRLLQMMGLPFQKK